MLFVRVTRFVIFASALFVTGSLFSQEPDDTVVAPAPGTAEVTLAEPAPVAVGADDLIEMFKKQIESLKTNRLAKAKPEEFQKDVAKLRTTISQIGSLDPESVLPLIEELEQELSQEITNLNSPTAGEAGFMFEAAPAPNDIALLRNQIENLSLSTQVAKVTASQQFAVNSVQNTNASIRQRLNYFVSGPQLPRPPRSDFFGAQLQYSLDAPLQTELADFAALPQPRQAAISGQLATIRRQLEEWSYQGTLDGRFYVSGTTGNHVKAKNDFLLPPPEKLNNQFFNRFNERARPTHDASQVDFLAFSDNPEENLMSRFDAQVQAGIFHETSFVPSNLTSPAFFDATVIPLDGRDAVGAGQTRVYTVAQDDTDHVVLPFSIATDNQILAEKYFGNEVQFFFDVNNHMDMEDVDIENAYFRAWDKERLSLVIGKTNSLYEVGGRFLPRSLLGPSTFAGTSVVRNAKGDDFDNLGQIQLFFDNTEETGFSYGVAVEEARAIYDASGISRPSDSQELIRWPSFASRIRFHESTDNYEITLQGSGLVRSFGFDTADNVEVLETSWGYGAYGIFVDKVNYQAFFAGASGGEGIGDYITGVKVLGAVTSPTGLKLVDGFGTYIGYEKGWFYETCDTDDNVYARPGIRTNLLYGFAETEVLDIMDINTNRTVQQALANVVVDVNDRLAVGLEYQYGVREIRTGDSGENHRFLFVLAATLSPGNDQESETPEMAAQPYYIQQAVDFNQSEYNRLTNVSGYSSGLPYKQGL